MYFKNKVRKEMEDKGYFVLLSGAYQVCIKLQKAGQQTINALNEQDVSPEVILIQCGEITAKKKQDLEKLCMMTGCTAEFRQIPAKRVFDPNSPNKKRIMAHKNYKRKLHGLAPIGSKQ